MKTADPSLVKLASRLSNRRGSDIAATVAFMPFDDILTLVTLLPPRVAAETLDALALNLRNVLLQRLPDETLARVIEAMSPDDRTALLQTLPDHEAERLINLLSTEEQTLTRTLLRFTEGQVGHYMTPDYLAVKMDWTVERVLGHIREYGHDSETINVIFVIDDEGRLIDNLRIKELLFVPTSYRVAQITDRRFASLSATDDVNTAINKFKEHDRIALPVVDEVGKLVGIVTIDDILRLESKESTEDLQKAGGMEALEGPYMETPFLELMKKRARWLVILFLGEMFTATAMSFFEEEIAKAVVLALFLPLIISSGGNAGSQSSTLIIRAMALGEVKLKDWWRIMRREILSGLFLGGVLGSIGFCRVVLWSAASSIYGEHWLMVAYTILLSLTGVVLWGSVVGSMLPLILRRIGADPAVSSAPLVATLVDVTGITIYFTIAGLVLSTTYLSG